MTSNQFTASTPLTYAQAGVILEFTCRDFVAEIPAGGHHETDLQSLARRISFYLDADVDWKHLDSIVVSMLDLRDVDNGDHEALQHEGSATVDHGGEIRDSINRVLNAQISYALGQAGIHNPRYIKQEVAA